MVLGYMHIAFEAFLREKYGAAALDKIRQSLGSPGVHTPHTTTFEYSCPYVDVFFYKYVSRLQAGEVAGGVSNQPNTYTPSQSAHAHIHTCAHTHSHTRAHAYTLTHSHIYTHARRHAAHVSMRTHIHSHTHMLVCAR